MKNKKKLTKNSLVRRVLSPRATPMFAGLETTLFSVINAIGGFIRSAIIAALFGASGVTDIYYSALSLLIQPTNISSGALNTPVIPLLHATRNRKHQLAAILRTQVIMIGILTALLAVLGIPLVRLVFAGFSADDQAGIGSVFYVLLPTLPLIVFLGLIDSSMKAKRVVIVGNSGRLVATWLSVSILPLLSSLGAFGLGLTYLVAQVVALALVFLIALRQDTFAWGDEHWFDKLYFRRARPLVIAGVIGIIPLYFERYILSFMAEGSMTIVSMAFGMIGQTSRVFVNSVLSSFYPYISLTISKDDKAAYYGHIRTIRQFAVGLFGFLVIVGTIVAPYVFGFVYGRGQFTEENVRLLSRVFGVYLVRTFAAALMQPILYTYYAKQDMRTPVLTSVCTYVLLTLILNALLNPYFGVFTIPIVAGIAFCANLLLDNFVVRKRHALTVYSLRDVAAIGYTTAAICVSTFVSPLIGIAIATSHLILVGRLVYGLRISKIRGVLKRHPAKDDEASAAKD